MKIVVVGLGITGSLFAALANKENHDVIVVDQNKEQVNLLTDQYSVSGIYGNGASRDVLKRAGADTADVVVAATPTDEINMICCSNAKGLGARYCVALLREAYFFEDREYLKKEYHIDHVVNPKRATSLAISRQLGLSTDIKVYGSVDARISIFSILIEKDEILDGMSIREIRNRVHKNMLIVTVLRAGKLFVPRGDFVLKAGDEVGLLAPNDCIVDIALSLGHANKPVKNVMIVGGGSIGTYLTEQLVKEKKHVKIIERDKQNCENLRAALPGDVDICYAERIDKEVLEEEGLKKTDCCVLLTGSDETNLILAMVAWSAGLKSVITKINSPEYDEVLKKVNLHITIIPAAVTADLLLTFVRNVEVFNDQGNDIQSMFGLADDKAKAIEFIAYDNTKCLNIPFRSKEFKLKKDILIGALVRGNEFIIPNGDSTILPGDKVVVITKSEYIYCSLSEIFED